jgi:hypothetical protein
VQALTSDDRSSETTEPNGSVEGPNRLSAGDAIAAHPLIYNSSLDHIFDELVSLDHRLSAKVFEHRSKHIASDAVDQFRGLVITDSEIDQILANSSENSDQTDLYRARHSQFFTALRLHQREVDRRVKQTSAIDVELKLRQLSDRFALNAFEEQCVILCLAPEVDTKYEKLFAYLQDDVTKKAPTVGLALDLYFDCRREQCSARAAFEPDGTLVRFGLIKLTPDDSTTASPLLNRGLRLNHRIASFLLGRQICEASLDLFCPKSICPVTLTQATLPQTTLSPLLALGSSHRPYASPNVFRFHGQEGCGQIAVAEEICRLGKKNLLVVDAELLQTHSMRPDLATQLIIEAKLQASGICILHADRLLSDNVGCSLLDDVIEHVTPVFLFTPKDFYSPKLAKLNAIDVSFPSPSFTARKELWRSALRSCGIPCNNKDVTDLAATFRLSPGQIIAAAEKTAIALTSGEVAGNYSIAKTAFSAARKIAHRDLGQHAQRIEPFYGWDDIALPNDKLGQLHEIANRIRLRPVIFEEWGFAKKESRAYGISALFSGPPGTGKTMAAEVLAYETGLELYRVDLSQLVSKYIGETEKNLRQVFDAARNGNAILLFDEADSIFGKRSEVKDSHDRYANLEISFLLQQMEAHDGVVVIATNLRQNIDQAFLRRLQVIIDFPPTDAITRYQIWTRVFPSETQIANDIDFQELAQQIQLSGSTIKSIAIASAYLAASEGKAINRQHIDAAAEQECKKVGRTPPPKKIEARS